MTEHDMEELLWKYPDRLLNEPLEPFRKQPSSQVGRADLIFKDPLVRFLVVEIKKGVLPRRAVNQLVDYYGMLKREFQNESVELMAWRTPFPKTVQLLASSLITSLAKSPKSGSLI
jgi:RecB family endonuclease NucS